MDALVAPGRRVGFYKGLQQHFGDKKTHQGATRKQCGDCGWFAGNQLFPIFAQVADKGASGHGAAVTAEAIGTGIEAPRVIAGIGIPQIALRAG